MGLTAQYSDSVELKSWRLPQVFDYNFTAEGASSVAAHLTASFVKLTILKRPPTDPNANDPQYTAQHLVLMLTLRNKYENLADESFNLFNRPVAVGEEVSINTIADYLRISTHFEQVSVIPGEEVKVDVNVVDGYGGGMSRRQLSIMVL